MPRRATAKAAPNAGLLSRRADLRRDSRAPDLATTARSGVRPRQSACGAPSGRSTVRPVSLQQLLAVEPLLALAIGVAGLLIGSLLSRTAEHSSWVRQERHTAGLAFLEAAEAAFATNVTAQGEVGFAERYAGHVEAVSKAERRVEVIATRRLIRASNSLTHLIVNAPRVKSEAPTDAEIQDFLEWGRRFGDAQGSVIREIRRSIIRHPLVRWLPAQRSISSNAVPKAFVHR